VQQKNLQLFRKVKTGFLLFAGIYVLATGCSCQSEMKVVRAAPKLADLDSITDFSSNRNYPVPEIENIGPDLYARLRKLKQTGIDTITYRLIKTRKDVVERFGDGDLFEVTNYYQNGSKQRYFVFSVSTHKPLKIIGY